MNIPERNTKVFKDIINTIIVNRGHKLIKNQGKEIHFNFNLRGDTKDIRIGGERIDDLISYYWYSIEGQKSCPISYVTGSEYKAFLRDQKIGEVIGEKTEIVSKKRNVKEQKPAEWIPVVGQKLGIYDMFSISNIEVLKVTPMTFTYKYINGGSKTYTCRLQKSGYWGSFSQKTFTDEQIERRRLEEMYR